MRWSALEFVGKVATEEIGALNEDTVAGNTEQPVYRDPLGEMCRENQGQKQN